MTLKPVWLPLANRTLAQRKPSPERLYAQKEWVVVGTLAKVVSRLSVSVENVSLFCGDVVKESSSMHACRLKASMSRDISRIVSRSFIMR